MAYILSVDAGTTASKVALFDTDGRLVTSSTIEYALSTPSPLEVEVDASTLWNAFKTGVEQVIKHGVVTSDIRAIGISAQGETLIPVDAAGNPLRKAIVWLDNRANVEADLLNEEFNHGSSYAITGQVKIVPTWPAAKIFWLKRHEVKTFQHAKKYLLVEDYLIHKMTGEYVAEGSLLCSTTYWNIRTRKWWDEMLDFVGITADQLPNIRESGEPVGQLLPEAARELGLSKTTLVATGALDQAAGAVGVGNTREGLFSENTGAALAICAPLEEFKLDPKKAMPIHYFVKPSTYMVHTFTTGGMVLRWFRDKFCEPEIQVASQTGVDPYDVMGSEAAQIAPGSEGLVMLPHLQGAMAPESNPYAKGVFCGFTLHHTRAHFVRAIMESIACIVRRNIEAIEEMGLSVRQIRALGGGAKSKIWKQIEADVTKRPVVTTQAQAEACLGAAILAGKAAGLFKSIDDACSKMVQTKERFEPNNANFKVYDDAYERYVQLYDSLCPLFEREGT